MMENSNALSLSQLQQSIGNAIRLNVHLQNVWVTAELSDLRVSGGHCYMELIEKDSLGNTCAKVRAMIWSGTLNPIRRKFFNATGRDIGSGLKVMVRGSVTHHNIYGLSFVISDIDPSYTLGDIERLRREILQKLANQGILDRNKQLVVPIAPQRIAVVSAGGAAGYGDFIDQLERNSDGLKFYPFLFPAMMQGDRTSASVRSALALVESTIDLWDCVAIIRGGGSTSDLNGFDDYELAKTIAMFPLPVIVGIGHERDRTVLDEIACVRCKTPTAVAAYLVDSLRSAYQLANDAMVRVANYASEYLRGEKFRIANLENLLPLRVESRIARARNELSELAFKIERSSRKILNRHSDEIVKYAHRLQRDSEKTTASAQEKLRMFGYRYGKALENIPDRQRVRLEKLESMIRVLSPQNTLKRGYSISLMNGKALLNAGQLKKGDKITTKLAEGDFSSVVE